MTNKVLIREAQASELEAVEALVKGAYREFRELVPEEGWARWMASITLAEVFTGTPGVFVNLEDTIKGFKGLTQGDYDHLPEASQRAFDQSLFR